MRDASSHVEGLRPLVEKMLKSREEQILREMLSFTRRRKRPALDYLLNSRRDGQAQGLLTDDDLTSFSRDPAESLR